MSRQESRVVVVTGAARGIGYAAVNAFLANGDIVVAADRDEQALRGAYSSDKLLDGLHLSVTDISKPSDVSALFQFVGQTFGRLHVLINNAGFGTWKSPLDLTVEEWDDVINTNLRGTFLCSREAAVWMKSVQGASIVNMASTRAFMSEPNSEAYAASKGGIVALTHALALSLGPLGIRVNSISPGWIETKNYESLRSVDHAQHPSGRVGTPDDIARACLFLSAPGNDFITGENLVIDGGMTRKMVYEPDE